MFEQFFNIIALFMSNFTENVLTGVIMVSAIIVFIGLLKPLLFDRIKFKPLRKAAIAFSSAACCFIATAFTFWLKSIDFSYYLYATAAVFAFMVIVYWFYENTCFRNLIKKIGTIVLTKLYNSLLAIMNKKDAQEIKQEVIAVKNEIRKELKLDKSKVKTDKELSNL
jgi:FtsH-binding integral membrane protein